MDGWRGAGGRRGKHDGRMGACEEAARDGMGW